MYFCFCLLCRCISELFVNLCVFNGIELNCSETAPLCGFESEVYEEVSPAHFRHVIKFRSPTSTQHILSQPRTLVEILHLGTMSNFDVALTVPQELQVYGVRKN